MSNPDLETILRNAVDRKVHVATGQTYFYLTNGYFFLRSAAEWAPLGHAKITKTGVFYDYCARQGYSSVEEWYEDRGRTLLGLTPDAELPPLRSELCYGRGGDFLCGEELFEALEGDHGDFCPCKPCEAELRTKRDDLRQMAEFVRASVAASFAQRQAMERRALDLKAAAERQTMNAMAAISGAGAGAGANATCECNKCEDVFASAVDEHTVIPVVEDNETIISAASFDQEEAVDGLRLLAKVAMEMDEEDEEDGQDDEDEDEDEEDEEENEEDEEENEEDGQEDDEEENEEDGQEDEEEENNELTLEILKDLYSPFKDHIVQSCNAVERALQANDTDDLFRQIANLRLVFEAKVELSRHILDAAVKEQRIETLPERILWAMIEKMNPTAYLPIRTDAVRCKLMIAECLNNKDVEGVLKWGSTLETKVKELRQLTVETVQQAIKDGLSGRMDNALLEKVMDLLMA
jgi:hypothetical protein